jgi:epoxide hydrolase 4
VAIDPSAIATGNFAQVQPGIRLHYASAGSPDQPLLLCLHGFPEFWMAWESVLPRFAERFHAVAPDLRGFNLSSCPPEVSSYRASELVRDIDGLATALIAQRPRVRSDARSDGASDPRSDGASNIRSDDASDTRFDLIGHDWGGALAWTYAIAHPERVRRLVILNAPHPVPFARMLADDPAQQAASRYMNWLRRPGSEGPLAEDDFARLDRFFLAMGGARWYHGETRTAYHRAWAQPGALTGGVNYYRASPLHPPTETDPGARRLALDPKAFTVRVPTLVVWGEGDLALLPGLLDGLDEVVPDLTIERLPEATHWLLHEQPARIASLISDFLD